MANLFNKEDLIFDDQFIYRYPSQNITLKSIITIFLKHYPLFSFYQSSS